jgi:hypothetical protein
MQLIWLLEIPERTIQGEMKCLKADDKHSKLVTPFKKKETIVENTLMSYLVNHVYCLACQF